MIPVLKYYSYNFPPNDEELQSAVSISEKSKSVVMLYYSGANYTNDAVIKHVSVHPDDTFEKVKIRLFANYSLE